jgi:hypothetical protein
MSRMYIKILNVTPKRIKIKYITYKLVGIKRGLKQNFINIIESSKRKKSMVKEKHKKGNRNKPK